MFSSVNFLSKKEFQRAVLQGAPIVLYSPVQARPAITGRVRVEGPWAGTKAPVDDVQAYRGGHRVTKPRERLVSWHAEATVQDMRVVAVR
jgi:hypothetical protein